MSCFSKQILDYFYNIQNTGRILKPEAIGKAGSKKEGTVIEFSWRVKDNIILDARFRTFGDVNAIAISSIIATMMTGKSINDVLNITTDDVLEHLHSSDANYLYIIDVALNALINTYENYIKKYSKANPDDERISEFAENLRKNLEKIENGESIIADNYDLSNISLEESDESSYLQNLQEYNKNLEDNSIEKSLTKLLQGYTSVVGEEEKETIFKQNVKLSTGKRGRPRKERTPEELEELNNKVVRGRGRPRKERTPEEIEAELNKVVRGRGRPKKQVSTEELDTLQVKKGRGRPRKERTPEELEELNNKVVRGRGRPKKEKSQEELEKAQNQIKRGRGRPKKNEEEFYIAKDNLNVSLNDQTDSLNIDNVLEEKEDNVTNYGYFVDNNQEETSPLKTSRRRGRPRKERTPEELEELNNKVVRGRGRPKKEKSAEELEALSNKVVRGRGRPKKEKTAEEIEAELNKVKRGRGRPRKDETSVFGITKLSEDTDTKESEIPSNNNINSTDMVNIEDEELTINTTRGRGRPKKERTQEELEELENKIVRGRGRPKKEKTQEELVAEQNKPIRGRGRPKKVESAEDVNNISYNSTNEQIDKEKYPFGNQIESEESTTFQNDEDINLNENIDNTSDFSNIDVEDSDHNFATLENSFAPAQNKYGVGISKTTQYNVSVKKTKISKTLAQSSVKKETSANRIGGSVIRNYDNDSIENNQVNSNISYDIGETEQDAEENREPLSEDVSSILKNSSIQDALKALLSDD